VFKAIEGVDVVSFVEEDNIVIMRMLKVDKENVIGQNIFIGILGEVATK